MNKVDFAEWLKVERESREWSQRELGRRMGVSGAHVSHVESGSRGVTADFCVKLAAIFMADPLDVIKMAGLIGNSIPDKPETVIIDPDIQKVAELMTNNPEQKELIRKMTELLISGKGNESVIMGRASPAHRLIATNAKVLAT